MRSRLIAILFTGLILAIGLLVAMQVSQSFRNRTVNPDVTGPVEELSDEQTVTPIIVRSVSENSGELIISGTGLAEANVTVHNKGAEIGKLQVGETGNWSARFSVKSDEAFQIEFIQYSGKGAPIRSDETVFRIPPPPLDQASIDQAPRALIMLTASAGPSRVFQSPFRGLPTSDGISMGAIDYDESGGVIFSGTSNIEGRVRIYANGTAIGETRVTPNGRWYFIAADTLPSGTYDIRAELITEAGKNSEVLVQFKRLTRRDGDASQLTEVFYEPYAWQMRRALYGGGNQYTAIFAPAEADAIIKE